MRRWRAHHPIEVDAPGELRLEPDESHHLARVVRVRAGDAIGVFDGHGREWSAEVAEVDPRGVVVRLGDRLLDEVEPAVPVTLYQGACRHDRFDWVVQKCTEIGVHRIVPVAFARAERMRETPARRERWRRIAIEACKQSGRRRIPEIAPLASPAALVPDGPAVVLGPEAGRSLGDVLAGGPGRGLDLAVGPEGGLEPAEIAALVERGWVEASLGPRTLRTETAGAVALAIVLHAWADLGGARRA